MKLIPLINGGFAKVDDSDFEYLSGFRWRKDGYGYVSTSTHGRRNRKRVTMHGLIVGKNGDLVPDHKDGDKLNNQRENLRPATNSQNQANAKISTRNKSGFKGVSWHVHNKMWVVKIRKDGKQIHIGHFRNIKDAALAYDAAARDLFGEFARTNFPEKS